jgi:hypothetical protein
MQALTIQLINSSKLIMTKKLVTILCVLGCCVLSRDAAGQITMGAKTGVNFNQFQQPGTSMGVSLGAYTAYQLNAFVTVKLEPQYSLEGGGRPTYYRYYSQISDNIYSIGFLNPTVRFHNLQIPVFVEATLPELTDQTIVPFILVGGSYGIMMSATEVHTKRYDFIDNTSTSSSSSSSSMASLDVSYQKENVTDNYKRNQWSVWLGMGMKVKTGDRTFGFDVRYRHGLNNLNLLRFASPGNGTDGIPGTGGNLYSSTLSINFSMSILNLGQ